MNVRSLLFVTAVTMLAMCACGPDDRPAFRIDGVRAISVNPAHVDESGNASRQCIFDPDRPVNAVQISFGLAGRMYLKGADGHDGLLTSAVPGDPVRAADGKTVTLAAQGAGDPVDNPDFRPLRPEDIFFKAVCMSPHPVARFSTECEFPIVTDLRPDVLEFKSNNTDGVMRHQSGTSDLSVAVLIDQSGSMNGRVEPLTGIEYSMGLRSLDGTVIAVSTDDFALCASDYKGFRLVALNRLISFLDMDDRLGVFQFNESLGDRARIVGPNTSYSDERSRRLDFFGTNRSMLFETNALSELQSSAEGRAPLWAAVSDVYDYLKTVEQTPNRQLLVITDGPDTCAPDSPDFSPLIRYLRVATGKFEVGIQNDCSESGFSAFMESIRSDAIDRFGNPRPPAEMPVHVSFIQLQSKAYRDIDPAQQQIACLTGGHYFWIDSSSMPASTVLDGDKLQQWNGQHPLQLALLDAVSAFFDGIQGSWAATYRTPAFDGMVRGGRSMSASMNLAQLERAESEQCANPDIGGIPMFSGASFAMEGKLGAAATTLPGGLLDPDLITPAALVVADGFDRRATFFLEPAGAEPSCSAWMPLCSLATEASGSQRRGNSPDPVVFQKSAQCIQAYFDEQAGTCRTGETPFQDPCEGGFCCWGQCAQMPPETDGSWVLDEYCNWKAVESD